MPFRIGMLLYPMSIVVWKMSRPSAVLEFDKVEAYSPETSRKATSLGVPLKATARAVRKKLLVPLGDGRYYLDRAAVKRANRRMIITFVVGTLSFIPLLWLMF